MLFCSLQIKYNNYCAAGLLAISPFSCFNTYLNYFPQLLSVHCIAPNLNYTQLALKVKFFSKKTIVSENTVYKSVFSTFVARKMWCECGLEPHSFNLFFRFFGIAFQLFKAPRNVLIVLVFCKKVFPQCNRVVIKTL